MDKLSIKTSWDLIKQTGGEMINNSIFKLSASLAFYTVFSLGPMLMVIIFLSNFFWKEQAVEGILAQQINDIVGEKAALQIQDIIKNAAVSGSDITAATTGIITLAIGATTMFAEIQDSINSIWKLEVRAERGWLTLIKNRLLSFSLVVTLAFILLVSLVINGLVDSFMNKLREIFPHTTISLIYIVNIIITLIVTSLLFVIIFKVLPDAIIRWKDVLVGSVLTAVLFMLGRFAIAFYVRNSDPGSAYGAAGSIVILLLWIYFSSIILYTGAVFTKCYAIKIGSKIMPNEYAVVVQTIPVESQDTSLQSKE